MSSNQDFKKQLAKQIGFIERSAKDFDEGHKDEAFRIATALRVIFHQTTHSKSLITHLGSPSCRLRSTVPDTSADLKMLGDRKVVGQYLFSLATLTISSDGGRLLPQDQVASHHRMIPRDQWWSETFATINNQDYTHRALILWAANQDGGAHVDSNLKPEYEAIKAAGAVDTFIFNGTSVPIEDAHLVFLRSMAFEVLNSPELRLLAGL